MCWTLLCANTNNVNKTCALLQTTGGKDEKYVNAISILFFLRNRQNNTINVQYSSLYPNVLTIGPLSRKILFRYHMLVSMHELGICLSVRT